MAYNTEVKDFLDKYLGEPSSIPTKKSVCCLLLL